MPKPVWWIGSINFPPFPHFHYLFHLKESENINLFYLRTKLKYCLFIQTVSVTATPTAAATSTTWTSSPVSAASTTPEARTANTADWDTSATPLPSWMMRTSALVSLLGVRESMRGGDSRDNPCVCVSEAEQCYFFHCVKRMQLLKLRQLLMWGVFFK